MPFCTNSNFSVDIVRDADDLRLDTLFFNLTISGSRISGNVFLSNGPSPLSSVSGSCQSFARPDVSLYTLTFTWDTVTVFVIALIFSNRRSGRVIFSGRFVAARITDAEVPLVTREPGARPNRIPPADGDTGTATGQQT